MPRCFAFGGCETNALDAAEPYLTQLGVMIPETGKNATFVVRNGELVYSKGDGKANWHGPLWHDELMVSYDKSGDEIRIGNGRYAIADGLLTALVYDDFTGKLVEVVSWDKATYSKETALEPAPTA